MTIVYRVDSELRVVFADWTGEITGAELAAHWRALLADAAAKCCRGSVSDLREGTELPHYEVLHAATRTLLRPRLPPGWKAAVVATLPHHIGVVHQLGVLMDAVARIECFDDAEMALAWVVGGSALLTPTASLSPRLPEA
jgi:hypothetical protein